MELQFVDDTGASIPDIYDTDLADIQMICGSRATTCASFDIETANGKVTRETYHFQAAILVGPDKHVMGGRWFDVQTSVCHRPASWRGPRLSGIWIRHVLYQATVPDKHGNWYISDNLDELGHIVPRVNLAESETPKFVSSRLKNFEFDSIPEPMDLDS